MTNLTKEEFERQMVPLGSYRIAVYPMSALQSGLPDIWRYYREEMGLSQAQMAKMLGVTRPHYNQIEMGHKEPSVPMQRLMVAYLAGYRPYDWPLPAKWMVRS